MQIKPYIDLFGKENVKCITLEKYSSDPPTEIKKILSWLEVSQDFIFPHCEQRLHVTDDIVEQTRCKYFVPIDNEETRKFVKKFFPVFLKRAGRNLVRKS
jgi:hypothetical protein